MKRYEIISRPHNPDYPVYQTKRKSLANPIIDVICVVVLAIILMVAGYLHVSVGF